MNWLKLVVSVFVVVIFNAQLVSANPSNQTKESQKRHLAFKGILSVDAQNSYMLDLGGDGLIKFKFDKQTKNALAKNRELDRLDSHKVSLTYRAKEVILRESVNLNNSSKEATHFSVRNGVIRLGN